MNLADRVRGCVLGGAIGDALGAPVEFQSLAEIRRIYGPAGLDHMVWHDSGWLGAVTDDTQMTLFTMEGLIRSDGMDVPAAVHAAHRRWYGTQMLPGPPGDDRPQRTATGGTVTMDGWLASHQWLYARRAPGNACMSGLRSETMGTTDRPANPGSKGCGAVMRSAPFGLNPSWTAEHAFDLAAECAVQTHGHPSGYLAAGALAAITRRLLDGMDLAEAVFWTLETVGSVRGGQEVHGALNNAFEAAKTGRPSPERLEELGDTSQLTATSTSASALRWSRQHAVGHSATGLGFSGSVCLGRIQPVPSQSLQCSVPTAVAIGPPGGTAARLFMAPPAPCGPVGFSGAIVSLRCRHAVLAGVTSGAERLPTWNDFRPPVRDSRDRGPQSRPPIGSPSSGCGTTVVAVSAATRATARSCSRSPISRRAWPSARNRR